MCWSGPASLTVASIGVGASLLARKKGAPRGRWQTLLFFTAMELLQAVTYTVIDLCDLTPNIWLTRLSYIHIAIQPFFINIFAMTFVPEVTRRRFAPFVWTACTLGAAFMLFRFYVPDASWACDPSKYELCGFDTCSYSGDWHIAWRLPLNNLDFYWIAYFVPAFLIPLVYGSWRWVLYHMFVGPIPAQLMSSNKDERPAIWCLMSIGFLLATHIHKVEAWLSTPLNKWLKLNGKK